MEKLWARCYYLRNFMAGKDFGFVVMTVYPIRNIIEEHEYVSKNSTYTKYLLRFLRYLSSYTLIHLT